MAPFFFKMHMSLSLKISVVALIFNVLTLLLATAFLRTEIRREVGALRESVTQLRQDVEDLHHDVSLVDERLDQIEADFFD